MDKDEEMLFEYVKTHYQVPAELGREIVHMGKKGVIAADRGHYIGVNFDDDNAGVIKNVHPTDNVKYLGIGKVRPISKAQKRYQRFLEFGDCFDSFIEFCKWDAQPERSWNKSI